jgi:hypothetical protein
MVRLRESDRDLDNPSESVRWRTVYRYCAREYGSGILFAVIVSGAATLAGVILVFVAPSLLAAVLIIGGIGGLLVSMVPASTERIARWLSR